MTNLRVGPKGGARRSSFNSSVHGARGLFAAMVFVFHVVNSKLPTFAFLHETAFETYFLYSLKFGVELFFGISGYVILGALNRAPSIRSFAWDRITRIYPLLWATIFAISIVSLGVGRPLPYFGKWFLNLLAPPPFISIQPEVNPAAWSLGYEVTLYSLCAFFFWLHHRGARWWPVLAVAVATIFLVFFPRAVLMPAGIIISITAGRANWVRRWTRYPALSLIAFLVLWRLCELAGTGNIMTTTPVWLTPFEWAPLFLCMVAVGGIGLVSLWGIANYQGVLSRLLQTSALQRLGTVSYSFYLWHPVVMGTVKPVLKAAGVFQSVGEFSQLLFGVVCLPPSLIIAHYSQLWIEVRLTRMLRRVGPTEGNHQAPITATS